MGCVTPTLFLLCACGALLSYYAVYIEQSKQADVNYKAHCDLDETIACSKVLSSEYSRGMGGLAGLVLGRDHMISSLPNSYFGLIFFPVLMFLSLFSSRLVIAFALMMTCVSLVFSVYLLYILVYVMNKICLICMPVHFINLLTFILFTVKWRTTDSAASQRDSSKKTQ